MEDVLELGTADDLELEDQSAEGEQPAEGAESTGGEQPAEGEEQPQVTSLFEPDGKKVAKPIRETLAKLKTENPSVAKLITDAVYRTAEFRREFPGGLTEVRELRDQIEGLGGVSGIQEKLEGAEELNKLALQFTNGDPAFVEDMVASSPESFAKLAPIVFDRFKETDPDHWKAYIGRIVYTDLQTSSIPLFLMRLADHVKDKPEALDLVQNINAYLGAFKELAEKAPAAVRPGRTAARPTTEDQRENDLRAREWNADRKELQMRIRSEAVTSALAGRKANTEEKAQIAELFNGRAVKLADRLFPKWQDISQGYIKRNDKKGYLRYMESIYRRVVPEAMTSAVASTLKRTGSSGVTRPGDTKPPASGQAKPAEGFALLAKEPDSYNIDYDRTNRSMLMENRAVLKDGKKVTWR